MQKFFRRPAAPILMQQKSEAHSNRNRSAGRVLKALDATPKVTEQHFFWDGTSKLENIISGWRKRLVCLFVLAELHDGHAHRFRDTFAVELLLSSVPMDRVSILLGHSGIKTTEKHYAPWVRARQDQLEAELTNAWSLDPVILAETGRARRVRGRKRPSNSLIPKPKIWRRGWESNPRMEVLQTSPLGHLGTAPNF